METFGNPVLEDVQLNNDGTLKQSGKQNVRFYKKKFLEFRARPLLDENGNQVYEIDEKTKKKTPLFDIDPRTGIPFKDAVEVEREMIRVETRGDTNIKDDTADAIAKHQYPRQYRFFREGKMPTGHDIQDFDFIQPNTIVELRMLGIHVIEEMAAMDDLECAQIKDQSGYELRDIAIGWVRMNSPQGLNEKTIKLERELEAAKRELEELKSRKGNGRLAIPTEVIESPQGGPEKINTIELTPEQLKKGKGRKRLVE